MYLSGMSTSVLTQRGLTWLRITLSVLFAGVLTACASPITTRVTSFNEWPANAAGSTFSYIRRPGVRELEQAAYENYVQLELEKRGLKRAPAGQAGRIQVDVAATNHSQRQTYNTPVYQNSYVYLPPYRDAAGHFFPGFWEFDPFGPRYVGERQVSNIIQITSLQLRLLDTQGSPPGKARTVFESRALYEGFGDSDNLPVLVPYLVRAIFDEFPGQSGRVRTVQFDSKTAALIKK